MRIITLNTNGIRAAAKKGFFAWLATQDAERFSDHAPLIMDYDYEIPAAGYIDRRTQGRCGEFAAP